MSRLVLDASAAVRLILGHPAVAPEIFERLAASAPVLAPHLYYTEVANALWKYVRAGALTEQQAIDRFGEARELISRTVEDATLLEEAISVAARHNHPVYDTLYAVLARRNSCPVLTMDKRLMSLLEGMVVDRV